MHPVVARGHDVGLGVVAEGVILPALRSQPPEHVFPVREDYVAEARTLTRQLATIGVTKAILLTDERSMPNKRQALAGVFESVQLDTQVLKVSEERLSIETALTQLERSPANALLVDLGAASLVLIGEVISERQPKLPAVIASLADPELTLSQRVFRGKTFGFTSVVPNPESLTSHLATQFRKDIADAPDALTHAGLEAYLNLRLVLPAPGQTARPRGRSALQQVLSGLDAVTIGDIAVAPSGQPTGGSTRIGLGVDDQLGTNSADAKAG